VFGLAQRRTGFTKARMKNKRRPDYQKEAKLNIRNLDSFRYYLKEILERSSMNEDFTNSFTANLITKGSRVSLSEAKEYVRSLAKDGVLDEQTSEEICRLLDKYRKYR
jgi:hypothetical protein